MKTGNKKAILSIFAASALLQGCLAQENTIPQADTMAKQEVKAHQESARDPLLEIKRVSIEARDELRLLAKAEQAASQMSMTKEQHAQKSFQALHVPDGFEQRVTIKYMGPAETVSELVAEAAGYEFRAYGQKPVVSMYVNLNLNDQPLNDALKEIGMQTGESAMLEVYEEGKILVLNYNPS
jgi:hypothetical protein